MSESSRILSCSALCLGLSLAFVGCAEAPPVGTNLLLVTIDTLRADRLGCYGGAANVGSAICSLAENGTRFRWALAAAPSTAPSVASILTSLYPADHGVTESAVSFLAGEIVTLAEILAAAGYTTAAFVSNPVLDRTRNLEQGFAVYDLRMTRRERNRPGLAEREARATTDAALAWANVAARSPWFLWVHYQDPHGPYEPPDTAPGRDEPGSRALPVLRDQSGKGGIPAYQALPGLFTHAAYERRYIDEIVYLDPHLKRLVSGLDALGEPPAVLLTADHGEAFGEDGYYFAHGHSVALDQIRVPLIWRPSRPGPARVVETPVSLVDVAPTLLRAAELEIPEGFQGLPLPVSGSESEAAHPVRAVFSEHRHRIAVVAGPTYYARDKSTLNGSVHDPISGGMLSSLPPRIARLVADDRLPPYVDATPDGPASQLEPLVSGFLEGRGQREKNTRSSLPADLQERLRALGYLD